ncbi:MAG: cardiolipin synthase, partial [Verrucomicrobia bacterium]|nr:cardiolipin synthase [Verrucomicrobiota bacterium]
RTAQGAIAWSVSLMAMPLVAVPAYWFLGRNRFRGYITARQSSENRVAELAVQAKKAVAAHIMPPSEIGSAAYTAERLADVPVLNGNSVDLLVDGEETFKSILDGLDLAEKYILFQFFIVKDDELGREVKAHLVAKAKQGVRIYFLYDEVGSHTLTAAYKKELLNVGIEVQAFNTRKGIGNHFQINFRNHRKVVVVDGKTSWVGGHNVGDEYMGKDPKFGHWRDTHVRIEGPATLASQFSFVEDWLWATDQILDLNWIPTPAAEKDDEVLIIPTGPADPLETVALMFIHVINSAQKRIWIASPYFVPDESIVSALQLAGLRGVDVRVLLPEKADHLALWLAAFSYFDKAGQTGVKFFKYTNGFLHNKVLLVDDIASCVGTANFDNRSFRLNFEITALVKGPEFARRVEKMFENDFADARPVTDTEYSGRPFWFRFAVQLARLTAPVQ